MAIGPICTQLLIPGPAGTVSITPGSVAEIALARATVGALTSCSPRRRACSRAARRSFASLCVVPSLLLALLGLAGLLPVAAAIASFLGALFAIVSSPS